MKLHFLQTNFPNGRSQILMRNIDNPNIELHHYIMVLSNRGELWVDVFWPFDEETEKKTFGISEQQFWHTFRDWRLTGLELGDSSQVAEMLAKKQLDKKASMKKLV